MRRAWPLLLVGVLSVATRFAFYGWPPEVVLDEVLVGKFVSAYFTHTVVFDSHPALAKLLVAGFAALFGWQPGFTFLHIGQPYPDAQHLVLRFLPTLAGTLLPVAVWLLARELGFSRLAATTAGVLVVFENALLTASRFLLTDSFLLLFGFTSLWCYLRSGSAHIPGQCRQCPPVPVNPSMPRARGDAQSEASWDEQPAADRAGSEDRRAGDPQPRGPSDSSGDPSRHSTSADASGLLRPAGGAERAPRALGVDRTRTTWKRHVFNRRGDAIPAVGGDARLPRLLSASAEPPGGRWRRAWLLAAGLCAGSAASVKWTGLAVLGLPMLVELVMLVRERRAARLARVGALAAAALAVYVAVTAVHISLTIAAVRTPVLGSRGIVANLYPVTRDIYNANRDLSVTHPYGSAWYTWPLMIRPLYCWNDAMTPPGSKAPARPATARIYLLGNPLVWWGSSLAVVVLLVGLALRWWPCERPAWVLAAGYFLNLLPFAAIGRVMFLYHYFPALVFAILILAWFLDRARATTRWHLAVMLVAAAVFLFVAPLSYGLRLSPSAYELRVWLPSWQ